MDFTKAELIERFTWVDYCVFAAVLALSAGIGIFYGCFRKAKNSQEFLMAGRSMGTVPVAMSLIASFMSAITILGNPAEIYQTGFIYFWIGIAYIVVMLSAAHIYFPVFWDLKVTSAYEYLEKRFNVSVRRLSSMLFILQMSLYMAIVVYAPALALSQVTGINVYISVTAICFVCIFYTTIGGMKAVLWTDTLQVGIMYGCLLYIVGLGVTAEGGLLAIWEAGTRGNRINVWNFDPSPSTRHTFWNLTIGGYFLWITIYGVNQAQVQRYMCVKKKSMAINALYINIVGLLVLMLTCSVAGLVLYARYEHCDPLTSGFVSTVDQLLPLYVMDALGHMRGLPGLFVAGIFSGALSTVSSGMNSLAAITLEDFLKGMLWPSMSEKTATTASKLLSLFFGVLTFALVFVAEKLGNVLSAALSIYGVVGGPVLGVFTLGMLFPWANGIGAFVGTVTAVCVTMWINTGYQIAVFSKAYVPYRLPLQVDQCTNITLDQIDPITIMGSDGEDSELSPFYRISYLHYSTVACFTVIIVGMIVSKLTGFTDIREMNPKLISPLFHWFKNYIPGGSQLGINFKEKDVPLDELMLEKDVPENGTPHPALNLPEIRIQDFDLERQRKEQSDTQQEVQ